MENPFEIINKRLERIEQLLEELTTSNVKNIKTTKNKGFLKMPTDEEMDAYLMKHVFSKKKN
ncbi:MAG: hypothetical protein ABJI22_11970 [Maribacter sp.]